MRNCWTYAANEILPTLQHQRCEKVTIVGKFVAAIFLVAWHAPDRPPDDLAKPHLRCDLHHTAYCCCR